MTNPKISKNILKKELSNKQLTIVRLSNVYGLESKGILGYLFK